MTRLRRWELTLGMPLDRQARCRLYRRTIQNGAHQTVELLATSVSRLGDDDVKRPPTTAQESTLAARETEAVDPNREQPPGDEVEFQNDLLRALENSNAMSAIANEAVDHCTAVTALGG